MDQYLADSGSKASAPVESTPSVSASDGSASESTPSWMRTMDSARGENPFASSDSTATASAIARTTADAADSSSSWMRAMNAEPTEHRMDADPASAQAPPA